MRVPTIRKTVEIDVTYPVEVRAKDTSRHGITRPAILYVDYGDDRPLRMILVHENAVITSDPEITRVHQ